MNTRHNQSARPAIMRRIGAAMTAIAVALGVSLASAPASHAEPLTGATWVATPNGVAWTPQTVTVRTGKKAGPTVTIAVTGTGGGATTLTAPVNGAGFAYASWTPTAAGTFTLTASGASGQLGTASIVVVPAPTLTTLFVPGNVQPGVEVPIFAEVDTLSSSVAPSGTITVRDQNNNIVATGTLAATGHPGEATTRMSWTPSPGSPSLTAAFTPATNAFAPSSSLAEIPVVGGSWTVAITAPPVMYVGVPATLGAVVGAGIPTTVGGSAAFSLNIDGFNFYVMGGSNQINAGVATYRWTPTQVGFQTIQVQYASNDLQYNGNASQIVNIQPAPSPDVITVTPSGAPAWTSGSVGSFQQGTNVTLTPTSTSGNPVTMSSDGPCAFEDAVLTMLGPGTCTVTATSFGNGGSLSGTADTYTINIVAPSKKKTKKRS